MSPILGLKDCVNVRTLKIFVECDPSDEIYNGFRAAEGFYEGFCRDLVDGVLREVEGIEKVEFDAWSGVKRNGDMMVGLREVVDKYGKTVAWGPDRGWGVRKDEEGAESRLWLDAVLVNGGRTRVVVGGSGGERI